jgi:adenylate cyclase
LNDAQVSDLAVWITEVGLAGRSQTELLAGFCERATAAGLPLAFGLLLVDTLHPRHEGRAVSWNRGEGATIAEYGRTTRGEAAENWRRSILYRLFMTGEPFIRRRLTPEAEAEFPGLRSSRERGMTDYVGILNRFAAAGAIGELDCILSAWTTDRPAGFADDDIAVLRRLVPFLAIAMKCTALAEIAETLVSTYLGRDAGRLVLSGRIERGVADRIDAVLWFSDLHDYTRIAEAAAPEQIIPLLNDYAEAVIAAIDAAGGDVLKLIGDGVLAIFRAQDRAGACRRAIEAAIAARDGIAALNRRRAAEGAPTTHMYLGLHVGEVFFGNVGSESRLDFTVVGPAVNEVSRIAALCRAVDQTMLASAAFAGALGPAGPALVSVGRYALRGVSTPQELFTLDAEQPAPGGA